MNGRDARNDETGVSEGGPPPTWKMPRPPRLGSLNGMYLALPFILGIAAAHNALTGWVGLALEQDYLFGAVGAVLFMFYMTDWARPAGLRDWAILVMTAGMAGFVSALTALGTTWLLARAAPDLAGGTIALLVTMIVCGAAIWAVLWAVHCLRGGDDLIFSQDEDADEGGAA